MFMKASTFGMFDSVEKCLLQVILVFLFRCMRNTRSHYVKDLGNHGNIWITNNFAGTKHSSLMLGNAVVNADKKYRRTIGGQVLTKESRPTIGVGPANQGMGDMLNPTLIPRII